MILSVALHALSREFNAFCGGRKESMEVKLELRGCKIKELVNFK
jgi:hypothetical protein